MDDPIFDPWWIGGAGPGPEPKAPSEEPQNPVPPVTQPEAPAGKGERSPRWLSAAAVVAKQRLAPRAMTPPPEATTVEATEEAITMSSLSAADPPKTATSSVESPRIKSRPQTPRRRPTRTSVLTERAKPKLQSLAQRLELAGHQTVLDDRLDTPSGSLRFRLTPQTGPFDEPSTVPGTVLELRFDAETGEVNGSIWLNPLSESPTEESAVDATQVSDSWIDDLLLRFVEKTLRRS